MVSEIRQPAPSRKAVLWMFLAATFVGGLFVLSACFAVLWVLDGIVASAPGQDINLGGSSPPVSPYGWLALGTAALMSATLYALLRRIRPRV